MSQFRQILRSRDGNTAPIRLARLSIGNLAGGLPHDIVPPGPPGTYPTMAIRLARAAAFASSSAVALTLAAFMPATASAEEQPAAETGGFETVIVTARKREESAQDVPTAITALRGDALTTLTSGGSDIGSALSARVPSLVVESSFGRTFPRFYIRGLGNTDFDLNASQPVSLVYDEVIQENPILKGFPVFDVERIEVLRGPQGTLFGRNTPAGIVKFDSVRPDMDGFSGYGRVGLRTYEGRDVEGAVNIPLGTMAAARISALYQDQGDYITNRVPFPGGARFGGFEDVAVRAQLLFQPTEQFSALLNLHGRSFDGTSQIFRANVMTRGQRGLNGNFVHDEVRYDGGNGNNQALDTFGGVLKLEYDFGPMTLTSITGYESVEFFGRGDIDGGSMSAGPGFIPFPADTGDGIDDHSQVTQEVRLSSNGDGPLSWQLGAYMFQEELSIYSLAYFSPTGVFSDARQKQDTDSWSLFGSATWEATDRLSLTAGLRYTDDEKELTARGGIANIAPVTVTKADDGLSWDLSAVYAAGDNTNFYTRVARGYRAPSIQGRILFGTAVTSADSEELTSYEAGVKMATDDRTFQADVSVFAFTIDNPQFTAIGGAGNTNTLLNAREGSGTGFEAEVRWMPVDNLRLTGGLAYNGTKIKDETLLVAPCGAPCTVLDPLVGGLARIDGNPFPNAPAWTGNVTARYSIPMGANEFYVLTDWAYKGETNFFLYESIEFSESGFWEGGLRVGYTIMDGAYEVALYGRNILDEQRLVGGIDFNNLTGFVNQPRIVGAEFKASF
jgi:iron complex outermembrane recepter protein